MSNKCGNCEFFIGGGDWDLCCSNPPEESKFNFLGFLCYADSDACKNFSKQEICKVNENRLALIVNLFGGPGAGKSTGAALIFSYLKMRGVNAELVTEAAKDLTWEEAFNNLKDQIYVFGKQQHRLYRCADKVDVIITDSPIFLSTIYNSDPAISESLHSLVMDVVNKYENYNVLLQRVKEYNPIGRTQTSEESDAIKDEIERELINSHQDYELVNGDRSGYYYIANKVVNLLIQRGIEVKELDELE